MSNYLQYSAPPFSLGFDNMPIRFFCFVLDEQGEDGLIECTEQTFCELHSCGYDITYERYTVFDNGCRQICLTVDNFEYPIDINDLTPVSPRDNHGETVGA